MLKIIERLDKTYSICECAECSSRYKTKHAPSNQTSLSHLCHTCRNPKDVVLDQKLVRKHFNYDPNTGFMHWRLPNSNNSAGDLVGTESKYGYLTVGFQNKTYMVHRLIWLYQTGYLPEQVDHINHNKVDNSWINLREVSNQTNQLNRPKMCNNTSGVVGVYFDKHKNKYLANTTKSGVKYNLGTFNTLTEAKAARIESLKSLGFHVNHGN